MRTVFRLGVVSFLNSQPLVDGLAADPRVQLRFDVPARLPALLDSGTVDASLIPVVDVLRSAGRYEVVSDACIACDGETMTVRVFSRVPPDRVRTLCVDPDSHTSVLLARILWQQLYDRDLELQPLPAVTEDLAACESVLLIGDKVVSPQRSRFAYEVDLGGAWREHTGLPFVFAVWARRVAPDSRTAEHELAELLAAARDRGVARAAEIATRVGPAHGWPVALARRYLTQCLRYRLDDRAIAGANHFAHLCRAAGLAPAEAEIDWPAALTGEKAGAQS